MNISLSYFFIYLHYIKKQAKPHDFACLFWYCCVVYHISRSLSTTAWLCVAVFLLLFYDRTVHRNHSWSHPNRWGLGFHHFFFSDFLPLAFQRFFHFFEISMYRSHGVMSTGGSSGNGFGDFSPAGFRSLGTVEPLVRLSVGQYHGSAVKAPGLMTHAQLFSLHAGQLRVVFIHHREREGEGCHAGRRHHLRIPVAF